MPLIVTLFFAGTIGSTCPAEELQKFPNCTLVSADWADGDSFPVRDAAGNEFTVRLYGVDCIECQINDETDARRLRGQRRYFGISNLAPDPQTSIAKAIQFGHEATKLVKQELSKPFTVFTSFADARGDGKYKRVYAFVVCSDGEDLGEKLVRVGLGRAFGVYRETPTGRSREDYREWLQDLELWAAKKGLGVWSATDWDALPKERQQDRNEMAELELARSKPLDGGFQLNPNTAARDDLMRLPGIGEVLANRIIEARPFASVEELAEVPGIGARTLEKLRPFLKLE